MYFFAVCRNKLSCIHCIKIYSIVNVVFGILRLILNNKLTQNMVLSCVHLMNLFANVLVLLLQTQYIYLYLDLNLTRQAFGK